MLSGTSKTAFPFILTEIFPAIASNFTKEQTPVEWSLAQTGEDESGLNIVSTSMLEKEEKSKMKIFKMAPYKDLSLRTLIHSHPKGVEYPSGIDSGKKDIGVARYFVAKFSEKIVFKIFIPQKYKYIEYGPNSKWSDFNK